MNAARGCWTILLFISVTATTWSQQPDGPEPLRKAALGLTRQGTEVAVYLATDAEHISRKGARVLVIGGNDGEGESTEVVEHLMQQLRDANHAAQDKNRISFVPNVYPRGLPLAIPNERATSGYPPGDGESAELHRPESRSLWRWTGMYGADLVIDIRTGKDAAYYVPKEVPSIAWLDSILAKDWKKLTIAPDDFVSQLTTGVGDLGGTPAIVLQVPPANVKAFKNLDLLLQLAHTLDQSPARKELIRREMQETVDLISELSKVYKYKLPDWITLRHQGIVGHWYEGWIDDMRKVDARFPPKRLAAPFWTEKPEPEFDPKDVEARAVFLAELASRSEALSDFKDLVPWFELRSAVADGQFDSEGKSILLRRGHDDTSEAAFLVTPILCTTGSITRERKYFDVAVSHFRGVKKRCLREDGLYRHSPSDGTAWGRGNGYPALGLALALSEIPEDHPAFEELKQEFQDHIDALLTHQDIFGCWHQVIDQPASYREFSATCMIAWALKRGIDRRWLDRRKCQPALDCAWIAVKQRIGPKGSIVDICPRIAKTTAVRDYDRSPTWGVDARGGALALMLATEMLEVK